MSFVPVRSHRFALLTMGVALPLVVALVVSPAGAQTASQPQFASGAVTSIHGSSVQVDNQIQNSESTVQFTPTTLFEKRETASASAITVGACVRVNGTGSTAKGITATTVAVTAATSSGCTGGFGRIGGTNGGGRFGSGQRPRRFGNGGPPGGFRNGTRPANFAIANGSVVSISGDQMTVKSTVITPPAKSSKTKKGAKSTTKPKTTTKNVDVKLGSTTTITQTVAATASDVTVGSCVTATGTSAAGGVSATNVMVTQPVDGTCGRFGRGGFGAGGFGGGGSGGGGSAQT